MDTTAPAITLNPESMSAYTAMQRQWKPTPFNIRGNPDNKEVIRQVAKLLSTAQHQATEGEALDFITCVFLQAQGQTTALTNDVVSLQTQLTEAENEVSRLKADIAAIQQTHASTVETLQLERDDLQALIDEHLIKRTTYGEKTEPQPEAQPETKPEAPATTGIVLGPNQYVVTDTPEHKARIVAARNILLKLGKVKASDSPADIQAICVEYFLHNVQVMQEIAKPFLPLFYPF